MPNKTNEKLRYMTEAELIDQLKKLPGDSSLRTLNVTVTGQDCDDRKRGHPLSCAISTAVKRMLPQATRACTKPNCLTVTVDGRYLHFFMNDKAMACVEAFDQGRLKTPMNLSFPLVSVAEVPKASNERKEQINAARRKRIEEGRPDKPSKPLPPMRLRTVKYTKAVTEADELRAAIEKAKRDAKAA
jgi:hypothetical protein